MRREDGGEGDAGDSHTTLFPQQRQKRERGGEVAWMVVGEKDRVEMILLVLIS